MLDPDDPRAGLEVKVNTTELDPADVRARFGDIESDALIFLIAMVEKYDSDWIARPRVAVFSDAHVYFYAPEHRGSILRCIDVMNVAEIIGTRDDLQVLGMRMHRPEFDLFLRFEDEMTRDFASTILQKNVFAMSRGRLTVKSRQFQKAGDKEEEEQQREEKVDSDDSGSSSGDDGAESASASSAGGDQKKRNGERSKSGGTTSTAVRRTNAEARQFWRGEFAKRTDTKVTKLDLERDEKVAHDRAVVDSEFERIAADLRQELQHHRVEELDSIVEELSNLEVVLRQREAELEDLRETRRRAFGNEVGVDGNPVSKLTESAHGQICQNCRLVDDVRRLHPIDLRQRIIRLERTHKEQSHIVDNLRAALNYRCRGDTFTSALTKHPAVHALRLELQEANRRNHALHRLILESPYVDAQVKQRATMMAVERQVREVEHGVALVRPRVAEEAAAVGERKNQIAELEAKVQVLQGEHAAQLTTLQQQFLKYDEDVLRYVEQVLEAHLMNQSASAAARQTPVGVGGRHNGQPHIREAASGLARRLVAEAKANVQGVASSRLLS